MTPKDTWEQVQESGYLNPRTRMIHPYALTSFLWKRQPDFTNETIRRWQSTYVCGCLDSADFSEWKDHELLEDLMGKVSKGQREIALLSFPQSAARRMYLLDIGQVSPKTFTELFDQDLWGKKRLATMPISSFFAFCWTDDDSRNFDAQLEKYYLSLTERSQYIDGSFRVPEVWVPHRIPVKKIRLEGILHHEPDTRF